MKYNECKVCGANNGRAGLPIGTHTNNLVDACLNCHDTRTKGEITIHSSLHRTEDELKKTFALLDKIHNDG